jgi:hypothetical protein
MAKFFHNMTNFLKINKDEDPTKLPECGVAIPHQHQVATNPGRMIRGSVIFIWGSGLALRVRECDRSIAN